MIYYIFVWNKINECFNFLSCYITHFQPNFFNNCLNIHISYNMWDSYHYMYISISPFYSKKRVRNIWFIFLWHNKSENVRVVCVCVQRRGEKYTHWINIPKAEEYHWNTESFEGFKTLAQCGGFQWNVNANESDPTLHQKIQKTDWTKNEKYSNECIICEWEHTRVWAWVNPNA
jgi:hypothetical protein